MEFFKHETRYDFMGYSRWFGPFTLAISVLALGLLIMRGLNLGLDFTGGTQVEVRFKAPVVIAALRTQLEHQGFKGVRLQYYGSTQDILIRASDQFNDEKIIRQRVKQALESRDTGEVEIRKVEIVGSEVGREMAEQGAVAVVVAILATMVYIGVRFEYRLSISAACGLVHDALIILGVFSASQIEFDLSALAAVLAVLGYSLNDTIVVFDRIRENFRRIRTLPAAEVINLSINQTLSRTIMTSVMTLLVALALLFMGGESLYSFALALCIGIAIGTSSSIFVSGALALKLGLSRADLMQKPKPQFEGA